jgi:predicted Zn-dependent protease
VSDFYEPSAELDALVARAAALTDMGRPHDAADLLERASEDHPAAPGVFLSLAYHCLRADEPDRALDAADRAIAIRDDIAVAHRLRAVALRELGQQRSAVRAAEHAVAIDPSSVESYVVLGAVALDRGDWKSARDAASRALELAPADPAVLRQLAAIYRRLGDDRRAVEFERAAGGGDVAGSTGAAGGTGSWVDPFAPGLLEPFAAGAATGGPPSPPPTERRGPRSVWADRSIWVPALLFAGVLTVVLALTMPTTGQKAVMGVIGIGLIAVAVRMRRT